MRRSAAAFLALALGATSIRAERPGAPFLAIDPSVRAQALGGAQALLSGAEALGHNPAGLALLPVFGEATATYGALDEGVSYGHVALARRGKGKRTAAGLAITGLFADGGAATDLLGQPIGGSTDGGDVAFSAGLGGRWIPNVFWGVTGKGLRSTLAGVSSNWAWAGDAGLMARWPRASLGLSAHNLGTEIKFKRDGDPLPASVRLDGAWVRGPLAFLAQARFDLPESKNRWTAGVEYRTGPLALRGGALLSESGGVSRSGGLEDSGFLEKLSFGMGFQLKSARLDYALADNNGSDRPWHRLSLIFRWGAEGNSWTARAAGDRLGDPQPAKPKRVPLLKGLKKRPSKKPIPPTTSPATSDDSKSPERSRPSLKNFDF